MNQIIKWLAGMFQQRSTAEDADEPFAPVGVKAMADKQDEKNASEHTPTLPTLTTLDESPFEVSETDDFDPYNSGSFQSSKSKSAD